MQGNAENAESETVAASETRSPTASQPPVDQQPQADQPRSPRRRRRHTQPDRPRLVADPANQAIWIVGFECGVLGPYESTRDGRAEARSDLAGVARFYQEEHPSAIEKTSKK